MCNVLAYNARKLKQCNVKAISLKMTHQWRDRHLLHMDGLSTGRGAPHKPPDMASCNVILCNMWGIPCECCELHHACFSEKQRKEKVTPIGVKIGVLRHQPQDLPL